MDWHHLLVYPIRHATRPVLSMEERIDCGGYAQIGAPITPQKLVY